MSLTKNNTLSCPINDNYCFCDNSKKPNLAKDNILGVIDRHREHRNRSDNIHHLGSG